MSGLKPDAVVLVATIRALKYNGGVKKENLSEENLDALKAGIVNLEKHIENLHKYGVPIVVTLNSFVTDTKAEIDFVQQFCEDRNCEFAISEVWEKGGEGGIALANKVLDTLEKKESRFKVLYEDSLSLKEKIETVAKEIYGAGIGIPGDSIKKIWERFYKTDLSRGKDKKGTGLGLSIVKEIIQAHGENINCISTEGVGTEFIFTLPLAKEHA